MALRSAAATLARRSAATLAHRRTTTPSIHSQYRATATSTATATEVRADATTDASAVASTLASTQSSGAAYLSLRPAATTSTDSYTQIPAATDPISKTPTLGKVPAAFGPRIHHASRIPATVLGSPGSRALGNCSGNPVAVFRRLLADGGIPEPPPEMQAAIRRLEDDWEKKYSKLENEVAILLRRSEDPESIKQLQKEILKLQKDVSRLESEAGQKHALVVADLAELKAKMVDEYCSTRVHKADNAFKLGTVAWRVCTTLLMISLGTILGVLQLVKSGWASEEREKIKAMVKEMIAKMQIENEATLYKMLKDKVQLVNAELFVHSNGEIGGGGSSTNPGGTNSTVNPGGGTNSTVNPGGGTNSTVNPGGGTNSTVNPRGGGD